MTRSFVAVAEQDDEGIAEAVELRRQRQIDDDHREQQSQREAAGLVDVLAGLPGVEVFPSSANFISLRVPDAAAVCEKLLEEKVLIKNLSKMHPMLANCIRVTVSTPDENAAFLDAFKASLISN